MTARPPGRRFFLAGAAGARKSTRLRFIGAALPVLPPGSAAAFWPGGDGGSA